MSTFSSRPARPFRPGGGGPAAACLATGLAIALLAQACASGADDGAQVAGGADHQIGIYPTGRLLLGAAPATVLVARAGEPFISVGEFNERTREFPVGDLGQPVSDARRQVLDQLIDHKLLALQVEQGPATLRAEQDPYALERARAHRVIKTAVANPFLVSDEEARRFLAEHKGRFEGLDATEISAPEALLAVKFSMLSDRMQDRLRDLRLRERIEVSEELLRE